MSSGPERHAQISEYYLCLVLDFVQDDRLTLCTVVRLKFSKGTSKAVTNIIQGGTPPDAANMQPESNTPALDNLVKDVKTMGERLENATDEYRQKLKSERAETMSARQALATEQVKGQAQKRLLENSQNLAEKAHRENLHLRASNSKLVSQVREVHDRCAALQNQCAAMLAEYGEED